MLPTSLRAFPGASCIRHPILQGTHRDEHTADPRSGQGFLAGGPRAAADKHTPPWRRRLCPNMLSTNGDARTLNHRRDS